MTELAEAVTSTLQLFLGSICERGQKKLQSRGYVSKKRILC